MGDSYGLLRDKNNTWCAKYHILRRIGSIFIDAPLSNKEGKYTRVRFSLRQTKRLELTDVGVSHYPECSAGETKDIVLPRTNDSDCAGERGSITRQWSTQSFADFAEKWELGISHHHRKIHMQYVKVVHKLPDAATLP